MEFEDGDEECRARLERQLGESFFRDLREKEGNRRREQLKEEIESQRWKDDYSKQCPKCSAPIEVSRNPSPKMPNFK